MPHPQTTKHFEKLFEEYSDVVYRLCLYKTSDTSVAHDLTQETFLRLWKTISIGTSLEKPKSYIYQIARNLIIDHYTSKGNKELSLDSLTADGFEPASEDISIEVQADISLLRNTIETLGEEFRDVIYLKFIEGYKVKEIATLLDISENLASVRISRGKKKLNQLFEDQDTRTR